MRAGELEDGSEPAGRIAVHPARWRVRGESVIAALKVHEDIRGRHIGRAGGIPTRIDPHLRARDVLMDKAVQASVIAELAVADAICRTIEEKIRDSVPAIPLHGLTLHRPERRGSHPRLNGIARGIVGVVGPHIAKHLNATGLGLLDYGPVGCAPREAWPSACSAVAPAPVRDDVRGNRRAGLGT